MSRVLYFEIDGAPAPKGSMHGFPIQRKKGTGKSKWGAIVTHSDKSKVWEKHIRTHLKDLRPLVGPVTIELWFFLPRPKSVTRPFPSVVPDLDKLDRAIMDGLKDIWEDDSRVVTIETHKRYADEDFPVGVMIRIQEKVDDWDQERQLLLKFREQYRRDNESFTFS